MLKNNNPTQQENQNNRPIVVAPTEILPAEDWQHLELWKRVKELLKDLPEHFSSTISVSGISAIEVYSFGAVLGLTIEEEVVSALNNSRSDWDSNNEYENYQFYRQAETFPDVLLKQIDGTDIIMGIELKSWYLLAKEGEPSFRFTVSPTVCNPQDLLVVVPWVLSNVLSGSPEVFIPYIKPAKYIADYRNYWWQHIRRADSDTDIIYPENPSPYPNGREKISDHPTNDSGKNFGRIARLGIMDTYVKSFEGTKLLGKTIEQWRKFFKDN